MIEQPQKPRPWLRWLWWSWGLLTVTWLAAVLWWQQQPAHWPANPVAWWSGDRLENRPLWSMRALTEGGAKVVDVEGDAAFQVERNGQVKLGRWLDRGNDCSWTFWVRLPKTGQNGKMPELCFARALGPTLEMQIRQEKGRVVVTLTEQKPHAGVMHRRIQSPPVILGHWMHVAMIKDFSWLRLYVDGRLAAETINGAIPILYLAEFQFSLGGSPTRAMEGFDDQTTAEFDDAAVFDRKLSASEVAALASIGRSALPRVMDQPALAQRVWRWGWR